MPELLTVSDVAARYGLEAHAAARIIRKLPCFKVGNRLFVRARDLLQWEESRTVYPAAPVKQRGIPRRR